MVLQVIPEVTLALRSFEIGPFRAGPLGPWALDQEDLLLRIVSQNCSLSRHNLAHGNNLISCESGPRTWKLWKLPT